ncbi:hypothetical protein ABT150_17190 [Streptomyces mirabilis]|uniref:hypothetical protein n=1 Tax=Streptomyces mirabilis TaxID=68239 RepID=UPI0033170285
MHTGAGRSPSSRPSSTPGARAALPRLLSAGGGSIAFLASDAARNINSAIPPVDHGWSAI